MATAPSNLPTILRRIAGATLGWFSGGAVAGAGPRSPQLHQNHQQGKQHKRKRRSSWEEEREWWEGKRRRLGAAVDDILASSASRITLQAELVTRGPSLPLLGLPPLSLPPPEQRSQYEQPCPMPPYSQPPQRRDPEPRGPEPEPEPSTLQRLLALPTLHSPVRAPRNPVVLCHGLYGFDVWTPAVLPKVQLHYWAEILNLLRNKIGAEVIVTGVPGTGSVKERAETMHAFLDEKVKGKEVNFVAHSMGGLDCRHLLTHIQPEKYHPRSLTTISTPHRGSPFMDWCAANIGIGSQAIRDAATGTSSSPSPPSLPYSLKSPLLRTSPASSSADSSSSSTTHWPGLPYSLTSSLASYLLTLLDSPAYSNLTTAFTNDIFNPRTPDVPGVKYYSVAARHPSLGFWHPLFLPQLVLDASAQAGLREAEGEVWEKYEGNDGLVSVSSARWGEFLGIVDGVDHWEMRGSRGFPKPPPQGKVSSNTSAALSSSSSAPTTSSSSAWSWLDVNRLVSSTRDSSSPAAPATPAGGVAPKAVHTIANWISDRIPLSSSSSSLAEQNKEKDAKASQPSKPQKFDLERFYLALSRKLYDEGL